jgi:hypothetical protein
MAIYAEWAAPAEVGEWSLDVDDRKQPTEAILWRNDIEVARVPCRDTTSESIETMLKQASVSRSAAKQLTTQLAAKCASPKLSQ